MSGRLQVFPKFARAAGESVAGTTGAGVPAGGGAVVVVVVFVVRGHTTMKPQISR